MSKKPGETDGSLESQDAHEAAEECEAVRAPGADESHGDLGLPTMGDLVRAADSIGEAADAYTFDGDRSSHTHESGAPRRRAHAYDHLAWCFRNHGSPMDAPWLL